MEILQIVWFALVGVLLAAFLALGGFDFGEGIIYAFAGSRRRGYLVKNILPYWDANQVWLITAGGALFAAFPKAYSAVLSLMYTPVMLLLACLVVRVVAIEFYFSSDSPRWRKFWGAALCGSSLAAAALLGVALGAVFTGDVLCAKPGFMENFLRLFSATSVFSAVLCLCFFAYQGAMFAALKGEGELRAEFLKIARTAAALLVLAFLGFAVCALLQARGCGRSGTACAMMLAAYIPLRLSYRLIRKGAAGGAFACSAAFAALCVFGCMAVAYPYIIPPAGASEGLEIAAASSSEKTLAIMLVVALAGVPLAVAYNVYAHVVFSGGAKKLDSLG